MKIQARSATHAINRSCLDHVQSVDECLNIFESESWIKNDGLPEVVVSELLSLCGEMRRRGLGLEPNLIGRAVALSLYAPQRVGKASMLFSAQDSDFSPLMENGDRSRNDSNYSQAEYSYYQALELFPGHPAARVQYAHVLKEQHKYVDALKNYLDAMLYGAPLRDVEEHAMFAAGHLNLKAETKTRLSRPACWLPSSTVEVIYFLLLNRSTDAETITKLILRHSSIGALFSDLILNREFTSSNYNLLYVAAETGWGPESD